MEPNVKLKRYITVLFRHQKLRLNRRLSSYTGLPGLTVTFTNPSPKAFSLETATLKA